MALLPSGIAKTGVVPFQIYPKTIDQSLRFEDGDSAYLQQTFSTPTNRKVWSWSGWVKRGNVSDETFLFSADSATGSNSRAGIRFENSDELRIFFNGAASGELKTAAKYRDPSAWYHVVIAFDSTQATASNRVKMYVNGEQITAFATSTYPSQNSEFDFNNNVIHRVGMDMANTANGFDGYLAEVHFVDGTAYTADDFGELRSGIWVPKDVDVTYGTNGFYLDFADGAAIGDDESGNANDWTATNLVASDVVPDSPTNNFAVLSPLENNTGASSDVAFREGNLRFYLQDTSGLSVSGNFAPTSGKWYWEQYVEANGNNGYWSGLTPANLFKAAAPADGVGYWAGGSIRIEGVDDATGQTTYTAGDVVGIAVDLDGGTVDFYKNGGSSVYQADLPSSITDNGFKPNTSNGTNSGDQLGIYNFGQDSTFAGNLSAGGNTDANGIGDFAYAPPSGFLALCTSNLPDPVIDPGQEATADQHFNVYTYTGNGASQLIGDVVREIPDTVSIDQSLRFDHAGSTYLTFDPIADGDKTEWTFSTWFKRTGAEARMIFGQGTNGSNNRDVIYSEATGELQVASYGGSYVFQFVTDRIFIDSAAWYHLVVAYDSSEATDTDRVKIWVNGLLITNFSTNNKPALNASTAHFNSGSPQYIGRYIDQGAHWNGYQAETHWIDGTAYAATDFGVFDADGIWTPITPSVTYGANGWHIDYSAASYTDNGSDPDTFADQANSNDFSAYGIAAEDIVPDTPTNQFAVLDSNRKPAHVTLTEGNLVSQVSTAGWEAFKSAIGVTSGKWYWEIKVADDGRQQVGVMLESSDAVDIPDVYIRAGLWNIYYTGDLYADGAGAVNLGFTFGGDDVLSIAFDADTGQFWLRKNGDAWFNSGDPATGANPLFTVPTTERIFPSSSIYYTASRSRWNYGADATFAGDDTGSAGPYSDDNSVGEFYYQPPTGFLALAENNLIQYDDNPLESPDFVWIKNREAAWHHVLVDSVRGGSATLASSATDAEVDPGGRGYVESFNKNGFVVTSGASGDERTNDAGVDYVAWTWKAGGTAVLNEDGSIDSQVSANPDAGFSIASYTGTGSQATVGHGLSEAPEMVIIKQRSGSETWVVGHESLGWANVCLDLSSTAASSGAKYVWGNPTGQTPTTTTFGIGTDNDVNNNTSTYIAYCFHSVDGFSKVGGYTANNSTDGPFVYTGFRPKWIMVKRYSGDGGLGNWRIWDSERDDYNIANNALFANLTDAEETADAIDINSNGFKIRTTNSNINGPSGGKFIYLAFAEQPFKYSNAR